MEVELHQEKVDFINDVYEKGLKYWKKVALNSVSTKNETRELIELAPKKVVLVRKAKNQKLINIEEMICYLKSQYLEHNSENRTFIPDIPIEEPSFKVITSNLNFFLKSIKDHKNKGFKNKPLIGGWLLMAAKRYKRQNLSCLFEDWLYEKCGIKIQIFYNYRNLYTLISLAQKLLNCRVNVTYIFKNHEILFKYFVDKEQTPWKHNIFCTCETCTSYFLAPV